MQATRVKGTRRLLKNSDCRLLKQVSAARRQKNRSFGSAQDRLGADILEQYVGARRSSATKHMSLVRQPASLSLWMIGLTVMWLLVPQYLGATAIALIRTPDEIVAAADSKETIDVLVPGFVSSRNVCKIHKIRDHFYFAVAGYRGVVNPLTGTVAKRPQGGISTVEDAVFGSYKANLSIRENVDFWQRSIISFLMKSLDERRREIPEYFRRNFSILSTTDVVFFGIEHEAITVHHLQFRAQDEPQLNILASRWVCPGDCQDSTLVPVFMGERYAMESYWTERRFNQDDGLPKTAEALVDVAIAANPKGVGGPIDILRITRGKSSWIKVKAECRE